MGFRPPPSSLWFPGISWSKRKEVAKVPAGKIWGSCGFWPRQLLAGAAPTVKEEVASLLGQWFQGSGLRLPGDDKGGKFREESLAQGEVWHRVRQS